MRRSRALTVIENGTRECLALVADTALSGRTVARELDAALRRARPCAPGSACRTLRALRAEGLGVECVDSAAGVYRLTAGEIDRLIGG